MTVNNSTLLPKVEFESILLSITTKDTYDAAIPLLKDALSDYRSNERKALESYIYLVENQLDGEIPTQSTLIASLEQCDGMDFKNRPTFNDSEVVQKVEIFSERKRRHELAMQFADIPEEIMEFGLTDKVMEICNRTSAQIKVDSTYQSISDVYEDLYTKQVAVNGISFLCPELDKRTGGMAPGTICTVVGGSGSMKTTTVVNICYNAIKEGRNVAYLSLEEPPIQLFNKLMSRVSVDVGKPLPSKTICENNLDEKDQEILLKDVLPYFRKLPGNFYILGEQDLGNYNLSTFESKLKEVDLRAREDSVKNNPDDTDHGIDIVVVDHIQLLKYSDAVRDEFSVTNMYVSFFRQQSLSFLHQKKEITVILLSQANRAGIDYAQKHNGNYKMQHIAEANELERSSTYIISVFTDATTQISKLLKMGAVKLRNAALPMDTINVFADGEYYHVGTSTQSEQVEYSTADLGLDDIGTPDPVKTEEALSDSLSDVLEGFGDLGGILGG